MRLASASSSCFSAVKSTANRKHANEALNVGGEGEGAHAHTDGKCIVIVANGVTKCTTSARFES